MFLRMGCGLFNHDDLVTHLVTQSIQYDPSHLVHMEDSLRLVWLQHNTQTNGDIGCP